MKVYFQNTTNIEPVVAALNAQCATLPFFFPVTPDEYAQNMQRQAYVDEPYKGIEAEQFILGESGGRIVGFAHVARNDWEVEKGKIVREGVLRFFTYEPGYRAVGQALLDASETYLRERGAELIGAIGWGIHYMCWHLRRRVSSSMPHIMALLGANGYEPDHIKTLLVNRNLTLNHLEPPAGDVEIAVHTEDGWGRQPRIVINLHRNGHRIGRCETYPVDRFHHNDGALRSCYIESIGVNPKEQGKGWGRYLLQRTLETAQQQGYRNALLETMSDNYRAQLLYSNTGFELLDTTYAWVKKLEH